MNPPRRSWRDMTPMNVSMGTMLHNLTGKWRFIRPLYEDKTPAWEAGMSLRRTSPVSSRMSGTGRFRTAPPCSGGSRNEMTQTRFDIRLDAPDDAGLLSCQGCGAALAMKLALHLLCPCPPGWGIDASQSVRIPRMATLSRLFPLYEVENGEYLLSVVPEQPIGVADYFRAQGRFKEMTEEMTEAVQAAADRNWEALGPELGSPLPAGELTSKLH